MIGTSLIFPWTHCKVELVFLLALIGLGSGRDDNVQSKRVGILTSASFSKRPAVVHQSSNSNIFGSPASLDRRHSRPSNDVMSKSTTLLTNALSRHIFPSRETALASRLIDPNGYRYTPKVRITLSQKLPPTSMLEIDDMPSVGVKTMLGKYILTESDKDEKKSSNPHENPRTESAHDLESIWKVRPQNDGIEVNPLTITNIDNDPRKMLGIINYSKNRPNYAWLNILTRLIIDSRRSNTADKPQSLLTINSNSLNSDAIQGVTKEAEFKRIDAEKSAGIYHRNMNAYNEDQRRTDEHYIQYKYGAATDKGDSVAHETSNISSESRYEQMSKGMDNLLTRIASSERTNSHSSAVDLKKTSFPESDSSSLNRYDATNKIDSPRVSRIFRTNVILKARKRPSAFDSRMLFHHKKRPPHLREELLALPLTPSVMVWILRSLQRTPSGLSTAEPLPYALWRYQFASQYKPKDRLLSSIPEPSDRIVSRIPTGNTMTERDDVLEFPEKRGKPSWCNPNRINLRVLIDFLRTGKLCGRFIVRLRYGLGRR